MNVCVKEHLLIRTLVSSGLMTGERTLGFPNISITQTV